MVNYLIRRLFQMMIVILLSSMAIYAIMNLAPGGPLSGINLGADRKSRLSPEEIRRIEEFLGLHRPLHWRYIVWLLGEDWLDDIGLQHLQRTSCRQIPTECTRGVIRFDFGDSWRLAAGQKVIDLIWFRLPNTLLLMTSATLLSLLVAIPIGIYSAVRQYSLLDYAATTFAFFGTAMPVFWFGLMMIFLFSGPRSPWYQVLGLPYLPTGNTFSLRPPPPGSLLHVLGATPGSPLDRAVHLILPTLVLSLLYMAGWSRYTRSSMLEVLRQDYVRTARAKGLIERVVIMKHALRNALIPIVTILTLEIPGIFSGAVITETIFNYKGMGRLYYDALQADDWPVVMALLFITSLLVVFANLLADILYTIVDPRIRLE
jgi:ABC-type dipeptide/oligopeptide/nickel transport systems, permease components